jgi:nicotinamidase-related amidase
MLERERTALVVVDVQEAFRAAIDDFEALARNAAILVQGARTLELPIVVTEQYPRGLGTTVPEIAAHLEDADPLEKVVFSACRTCSTAASRPTSRRTRSARARRSIASSAWRRWSAPAPGSRPPRWRCSSCSAGRARTSSSASRRWSCESAGVGEGGRVTGAAGVPGART